LQDVPWVVGAGFSRIISYAAENQLKAFIERRRTNPVMFNVAHVLSPPMQKALAKQFQDLKSKAIRGCAERDCSRGEENL